MRDDPEARFEFLLEHGVLLEADDGTVATTERFDAVRNIYHDTYADVSDETYHRTVGSLFGLTPEEAEERVDELGVTRSELVAYLALDSYLNDIDGVSLDQATRVQLAAMVAGVTPVSPVPDGMEALDDGSYEAFLEANPEAVVFVWKLHCEPCDRMKTDLDEALAAVPEGVAVAGVDGEAVTEFRREFDVTAAPTTLTLSAGELVERVEGERSPDQLAEMFDVAFSAP